MQNIEEKAKQVHEDNVKKGFWDGKTPESKTIECLALIHSEVSETLEAHRCNDWANLEQFDDDQKSWIADFKKDFKSSIKDSVEDELADIAIRVLDLIGAWLKRGVNLPLQESKFMFYYEEFTANIVEIHDKVSQIAQIYELSVEEDDFKNFGLQLSTLLGMLSSLAVRLNNVDLERHIDLKLEYNKLRDYKHNKAY